MQISRNPGGTEHAQTGSFRSPTHENLGQANRHHWHQLQIKTIGGETNSSKQGLSTETAMCFNPTHLPQFYPFCWCRTDTTPTEAILIVLLVTYLDPALSQEKGSGVFL